MNGCQGSLMSEDAPVVNPITLIDQRKNRSEYYRCWYAKNKKKCIEYKRQWEIKNKERCSEQHHQWYIEHREKQIEKSKQRYIKNKKECLKTRQRYFQNNKEKCTEQNRQWKIQHPEKVKEFYKKSRIKIRNTPKGKLNMSMSSAIGASLRGSKNRRHWESLVGYTADQLRKRLKKQFKPGMTWQNYGSFWEIDHKIPIAVFNFDKPEHIDFRLCWSLKNLQPLEVRANRSKGERIDKPFQPSLIF